MLTLNTTLYTLKPVDFLLKEHNQKTQLEINQLFEENIPKLFDNKECKDAITNLTTLTVTN